MATVTIRHASFKYTDEDGRHQVAFRGQTVDIPQDEVKRGEAFNAFTDGGEPEDNGTMSALSAEATDQERIAWVKQAKVDEVGEYLDEHPDQAEAILDAEHQAAKEQDKEPRVGVVKAVEQVVAARSQ